MPAFEGVMILHESVTSVHQFVSETLGYPLIDHDIAQSRGSNTLQKVRQWAMVVPMNGCFRIGHAAALGRSAPVPRCRAAAGRDQP